MTQLRASMGHVNLTLPENPEVLRSAGAVALVHGQLELVLRMTIKSLAGLSVREALDSTEKERVSDLRSTIRKLFEAKSKDVALRQKMKALLGRCERLSSQRNKLIHGTWAIAEDGSILTKGENHAWGPAVSSEELAELASEISSVVDEMNEARLKGFIKDVCQASKKD